MIGFDGKELLNELYLPREILQTTANSRARLIVSSIEFSLQTEDNKKKYRQVLQSQVALYIIKPYNG